jgi:hypothetical protein
LGDANYWKDKYQDSWSDAATKEENIRTLIEKECNCTCEYAGLGAGKTEFLSGTAKSRGFEKGGSDLHVEDTNLYVEVTGPNVLSVDKSADLWVRPDKIENAIKHSENDYWVVHVLKKDSYMRVIHINDNFKKDYQNKKFKIIHPWTGRAVETYVAIPADSKHVEAITVLFDAVKKAVD